MEGILRNEIKELQHELAADPTLESCCRKDLEEQLLVAKCKAELIPQDRSQARVCLVGRVPPPPGQPQNVPMEEDAGSDSGELDALRALRLEEMQREAQKRKALQESEGCGRVTTVQQGKLLRKINESTAAYSVCHFCVEGDQGGEETAETMDALAARFPGTLFLRCIVPPVSTFPQRFGLPPGPGVVCLYNEVVLGALPLWNSDDNENDEDYLEKWLRQRGCLQGLVDALASVEPTSDEDNEEDEGDWQRPCEVCGRRFPHEHVRAVYRTAEDDEKSSDDDDDE